MRKPRVRFREYLFLVTLASVIAATIALRWRVGYFDTFMAHDFQATRARVQSQDLVERVEWVKGRLAAATTFAEHTLWQASLTDAQAKLEKATSDAERHERLARYYAP
jgi:hypothetical protein